MNSLLPLRTFCSFPAVFWCCLFYQAFREIRPFVAHLGGFSNLNITWLPLIFFSQIWENTWDPVNNRPRQVQKEDSVKFRPTHGDITMKQPPVKWVAILNPIKQFKGFKGIPVVQLFLSFSAVSPGASISSYTHLCVSTRSLIGCAVMDPVTAVVFLWVYSTTSFSVPVTKIFCTLMGHFFRHWKLA